MKKYVAYYSEAGEYEMFDTIDEAIDWLKEYDMQDGISEDTIEGKNFIAEIKLVSDCPVKHCKSDYPVGEWPYSDEFDTIHEINYIEPKGKQE